MSLLVTGSIAIDTVKTPHGVSKDCLGGSAVYFAMAASFFTPVRLLGAVGSDCPFDLSDVFEGRDVDLRGLEVRQGSKTFRWSGSYISDTSEAVTDEVDLNVLSEGPPMVPDEYKDSDFIFLANTSPVFQLQLLRQMERPSFVAADTMNYWIEKQNQELKELLEEINALIVNDEEARLLTDESNLVEAGEKILSMGPPVVIIKEGAGGAMVCSGGGNRFKIPAFPDVEVKDPTGAGDSFAGALLGYLSENVETDFESLKTAIVYGTVVASFTISEFSLDGLTSITKNDIDDRFKTLEKLTKF